MAARLPRSSMFTMSAARFFLPDIGAMPLCLPCARDADGGGEREAVRSPDEPPPALRAVIEVVEEVLDDPGQRPRLLAEIGGFLLRERRGVQREAAVLETRAGGVEVATQVSEIECGSAKLR